MKTKGRSQESGVRSWNVAAGIAVLLLLELGATAVHAQTNYSINWFTIGGGGGPSASAVYSVIGTIGQPDAGRMASGRYALEGGFWSFSVQPPVPMSLSIALAADNTIIVSWPATTPGGVLEHSRSLAPAIWSPVTTAAVQIGGQMKVTIVPEDGAGFYRLKQDNDL